jgi:hypothetical protein
MRDEQWLGRFADTWHLPQEGLRRLGDDALWGVFTAILLTAFGFSLQQRLDAAEQLARLGEAAPARALLSGLLRYRGLEPEERARVARVHDGL